MTLKEIIDMVFYQEMYVQATIDNDAIIFNWKDDGTPISIDDYDDSDLIKSFEVHPDEFIMSTLQRFGFNPQYV